MAPGGPGERMSIDEATRRLSGFRDRINGPTIMAALQVGGLNIQNRWKQYIRERAFETGTYERSVHMEEGELGADHATVDLGTDIVDDPYPFYLEFGTVNMAARPTARPAMDEEGDNAWNDFVQALEIIAMQELS